MGGYKVMFFFNIPQHGDLHLDKILFSFENVPMIFVCRNNKNEYFLCQCVDVITGISWMITPVSTKLLIQKKEIRTSEKEKIFILLNVPGWKI